MANTFIQIGSTVTVGSGGAANIEFTSIPATYTDLVVKFSGRSARTGIDTDDMLVTFNGASTNFSARVLYGSGSAAVSFTDTSLFIGVYLTTTATASAFSNGEIYIPNYAGSTNKSFSADSVSEQNATKAYATITGNLWNNTAAITSLLLKTGSGSNLVEYSTASLYGIKNS
jgi:hypothetical protein